jgi:hypothetical protein
MAHTLAEPTPRAGATPVDAALGHALRQVRDFLDQEVPAGCAGQVLDQITRMWEQIDQMKYQAAACLGRLEASGQLLDQGGQRSVRAWARHAFAISPAQATELELIARAEHAQSLPQTTTALAQGDLSLGEAAAIIKGVQTAVEKRDATYPENTGADLFRAKMEGGLLDIKAQRPNTSVAQIGRAAHALALRLDPDRAEREHEAAHAARGATLSRTFGGSFLFQAWGSAADALRLEAALEGFQAPYDPEGGTSPSERRCDAFLTAMGLAQAHQRCAKGTNAVALINITVPATTLAGEEGDVPALTQDGRAVPTSVVRELLSESLIRRLEVEQRGGAVLDVGRLYRLATPRIRTAAFHGHSTCAWEHGCDVPVGWAQADHIVEFWQGGVTSADNIQPLCSTHNRLKHRWGLRKDRKMWSGRTRGRNRGSPGDADPGADSESSG